MSGGDSHLEYAGVPAARFAAWQDVLRDSSRLDQLWPYLESVPRLVDAAHPHVAAQLDFLRRLFADTKGNAALNLSQALDGFEAVLLGLIGPQGQSPHAPRQEELSLQPPNLVVALVANRGALCGLSRLYPVQIEPAPWTTEIFQGLPAS